MSRRELDRLRDIAAACTAIGGYIDRSDADEDIVFDAIRARLMGIGEAVKDLDPAMTSTEPSIPWSEIARMRDHLAHRYFDTTHAIVTATARNDIPELARAVQRLLGH
ncbi:MAG TPA: HepT-like ribonuclease domain-containing protein [Microbacterium sp.]|nr:HepT-like ribonuclease domain-containing protein [Microbacterium sp.]